MKKVIAYAAAFALAFAQPYTVMCSELIPESQIAETENVLLAVKDDITVTNGKITLEYEPQMKLEEIKFCGTLKNALIDVNADKPGVIVIGFAVTEPVKITESLAEVIFSGTPEFNCITNMTVNELVTENENGEDVKLPAETLSIAYSVFDSCVLLTDAASDDEGNLETYLQLDHMKPFTNGTFTVKYDSSALEFTGGESCGILKDALYEINETKPGIIKFTFVGNDVIKSNGPVAKLSFKGKSSGSYLTEVSVDELSLVEDDGTVTERRVVSGEGYMNVDLPPVNTDVTLTEGTEANTVLVNISENSGITNGVFTLRYSPEAVRFETAEICDGFRGITAEFNEIKPGFIKVALVSDKELTAGGEFMKFKFSPVTEGFSDVDAEIGELMNINADSVQHDVTFINDSRVQLHISGIIVNEGLTPDYAVIHMSYDSRATNGVFTVKYDPELIKFESGEIMKDFEGVIAEFNETEPGSVKIAFASPEEITAGGDFIKLNFSELKSGECKISAEADEFMRIDSEGVIHNMSCFSGSNVIHREYEETQNNTTVVTFEGVEGLTEGSFTVNYNSEEFTFIDVERDKSDAETEFVIEELTPGAVKITFRSEKAEETSKSDFKITFRENKNEKAPVLSVTVDDVKLMAGENHVTDFMITFADKPVNDDSYEKYDIREDGSVTMADVIYLARMISGLDKKNEAADINNDGKVDSADLLLLVSYFKK